MTDEAAARPPAETASRPRKKKRKKKKRAPDLLAEVQPTEQRTQPAWTWLFGGSLWWRRATRPRDPEPVESTPAFAVDFPDDPALDRLVALFEAGNYAAVREGARRLAHATERNDVRRAARELARRTEPDPLAKYLVAIGFGLLVFLAYWYWSHPHPGP